MLVSSKHKFLKDLILLAFPFTLVGITIGMESCGNVKAAANNDSNALFKYREVYLPEAIGDNALNYGLNSLDNDWGIWGHNIGRMIPEKHSQSIYAKVDGNVIKKQYCFSSPQLFEYIEEYISNKYDEDAGVMFSIIPNDNDIVCICERCVAIGNTEKDASPAVTKLVRDLAARFPAHLFFTSDYKTTRAIPVDSMPPNTGVLVSAINFPLSTGPSREEEDFISRLKLWGKTTPHVLVWDYINNFDDYFTPFPSLGAMQRRLKHYVNNNVNSIFLNGSGPDISALSRLHTEVLAALTANPDLDWQAYLKTKAKEIYPVTGELIADYMLAQEDNVVKNGIVLPLYEGVEVATKTYLPMADFITFHDSLKSLRNSTKDTEREEIDRLLGELALTRLEINRISGNLENSREFLTDLQNLATSGVHAYNESGWSIDQYITEYGYLLEQAEKSKGNKLKGKKLIALTPLDPDYSDISILTDGVLAIPSNYHSGNLIMTPESQTRIAVPNTDGLKKLVVWMTYNPPYKLFLPEKVTLSSNGKVIKEITPSYPENFSGHSRIEFDVPSGGKEGLVLTFIKDPEKRSMALEEIEGY